MNKLLFLLGLPYFHVAPASAAIRPVDLYLAKKREHRAIRAWCSNGQVIRDAGRGSSQHIQQGYGHRRRTGWILAGDQPSIDDYMNLPVSSFGVARPDALKLILDQEWNYIR